jgi:pentatricopeptide repeat protein
MRSTTCPRGLRSAFFTARSFSSISALSDIQARWRAKHPDLPALPRGQPPLQELKYLAETTRLEATSVSTGFGPSASQVEAYNTAYDALRRGIDFLAKPSAKSDNLTLHRLSQAWDLALEQGFRVIDDLGFCRRLTDQTLAQLLELVRQCEAASARRDATKDLAQELGPTRAKWIASTAGSNWELTRRLVVICARASLGRISRLDEQVGQWAWIQVGRGQRGAERVLEIFEAVGGRRSWLDDVDDAEATGSREVISLAPGLYSAVVAALAVVPDVPPLPTVLVSLTPRIHCNANLGQFSESASLLSLAPASRQRVYHWVRQANLGLLWQNGVSGDDDLVMWVGRARKWADRNMGDKLLVTWNNIVEGSEGDDAWILTRWEDDRTVSDDVPVPRESDVVEPSHPPRALASSVFRPTFNSTIVAAFLEGFVRLRLANAAADLWDTLIRRRLTPPRTIWLAVLRAHSQIGSIGDAEDTLARMRQAGFHADARAWAAVVLAYLRGRDIPGGLRRLQAMRQDEQANEKPWPVEVTNELMNHLLKANQASVARDMFDECVKRGSFNIVSVNCFLRHYSMPAHLSIADLDYFLRFIDQHGLQPDSATFTILLDGLLRSDVPDAVGRVWDMMKAAGIEASVVTYATMINHLTRRQGEAGIVASLRMLDQMELEGVRTNEVVYTTLIQALCRGVESQRSPTSLPFDVLSTSSSTGSAPLTFTSPAASSFNLDGPENHPYLRAAVQLRTRMQRRNIPLNQVGYNALISAYLSLGHRRATAVALALLDELRDRNRRVRAGRVGGATGGVSEDTWYIILHGLMAAKDVDTARKVTGLMETDGFVVQSGAMAKLLDDVRRGQIYVNPSARRR